MTTYKGFEKDRELAIQRAKVLREQQENDKLDDLMFQPVTESFVENFNKSLKHQNKTFNRAGNIIDLRNKLTEAAFIDLLVESYFEVVEIDEFVKKTEEHSIRENANIFFSELVKGKGLNNYFAECGSNTIQELLMIIENEAEDIANDANQEDEIDEKQAEDDTKKNVKSKSIIKSSMSAISKEVSNKVKDTLKTEKEIAERNREIEQQLVTEGKKFHRRESDVSLFRSIFQNATTGQLKESEEMNHEFVFTETVLQYTLLEFANTLKLVEFNPTKVKELAQAYRHI